MNSWMYSLLSYLSIHRPYALTSRLHNNDAMLGVKTCRAARTCCAGRALALSASQSVRGPGPAVWHAGVGPLAACLAMAHVTVPHLTPNTRGALLWRHMHKVYYSCIHLSTPPHLEYFHDRWHSPRVTGSPDMFQIDLAREISTQNSISLRRNSIFYALFNICQYAVDTLRRTQPLPTRQFKSVTSIPNNPLTSFVKENHWISIFLQKRSMGCLGLMGPSILPAMNHKAIIITHILAGYDLCFFHAFTLKIPLINPLKTSPEYTRAGFYENCVLYSKNKSSSTG